MVFFMLTSDFILRSSMLPLQWSVFPYSRGKRELGLRENSRGDFNEGNAGKI